MILDKGRRHFRRYREIAGVLAKHGWGWMLGRVGTAEHAGEQVHADRAEAAPIHLRQMLEELGPTFVKLGQLLSARPDVVPDAYIAQLSKLQDTAPTLPISDIFSVIESEFEAPVTDLFEQFDEVPLAAASLAQVHRAKLPDGTPVIVKVQRPNIRELVETDIEIMYKRARFLESHWERARTYGLLDIVDEFALTIREELDYTREARNTDRLRENLAKHPKLRVPLVHWNLTTGKVLTLEHIHGTKITEVVRGDGSPASDPRALANRLASVFLEQVFVDGFFHADPHPGNVMLTDEGEIALVDCGQVGRLDAENKAGAIRLLMAFEQQDTRVLADEILDLGIEQEEVDVRRLTYDLGKVLRTYYDMPARAVNMGALLTRVLETSARHKVRLPVAFAVIGKVFTNIDGICRQLDPDFNLTAVARGYVGKAVRKEFSSESVTNELYRAVAAARSFVFNIPEYIERLMRKAVEGNLRLEFKHLEIDEVSRSFQTSANRIAIALIVAASIVGSSLIVATGRGARTGWFGLPTLGVLGYIVTMVFGAWLIVSIIRSGKHK